MSKNNPPKFPSNLLGPVANALKQKLSDMQKIKKEIASEDPFRNMDRVNDNAATDIEADEQNGHARTFAIKTEMSRGVVQIRKALSRIKLGKYGVCEVCGNMIDTDRLMIYPEATLCAKDSARKDK